MSVMVLCRIIEYNFDLVFLSSKTSTKNISMCIRDFFFISNRFTIQGRKDRKIFGGKGEERNIFFSLSSLLLLKKAWL